MYNYCINFERMDIRNKVSTNFLVLLFKHQKIKNSMNIE